jgi:glycopeptide antibiotics resistance protein
VTAIRKLCYGLWALYIAFLVYVLFLRRMDRDLPLTYLEYPSQCYNLIPGKGIYEFFTIPVKSSAYTLRFFTNYVGNLLLFLPWGILTPAAFSMQKKRFVLLTVAVILSVELAQYLSMLGSFDVEDLILNVIGAMIGFAVFRWITMRNARKQDET